MESGYYTYTGILPYDNVVITAASGDACYFIGTGSGIAELVVRKKERSVITATPLSITGSEVKRVCIDGTGSYVLVVGGNGGVVIVVDRYTTVRWSLDTTV